MTNQLVKQVRKNVVHAVDFSATTERRNPQLQSRIRAFATTYHLTAAETAVLTGLLACRCPKTIAKHRGVAVETVRSQIQSIFCKGRVHTRTELIIQVLLNPAVLASETSVGASRSVQCSCGARPSQSSGGMAIEALAAG